MKRKLILGLLLLALVALPLCAACEEEVTTTPPTTTPPTTETTTPAEGPVYGGTITMRAGFIDIANIPLDPRVTQFGPWYESLFTRDIAVPTEEFSFLGTWIPVEYCAGQIAESWEYKEGDPLTIIVQIRQGIKWLGPPTGGRELTADDVEFTYNKIIAAGEFAGQEPNPFYGAMYPSVEECVATGPYTVEFHLKAASPFAIDQIVMPWINPAITCPEWYDLTEEEQADWHNFVGTGPFMATDFVAGTSITCVANPDYYYEDARYPGNRLPYADELRIVVIPDMDTALSAMRTGEIDMLSDARTYPSLAQTQALEASNPEINIFHQPVMSPGLFFHWNQDTATIDPPFDDIRVRKAMQLAIDNALIAETLYQGTVDGVLQGLMSPLVGEEWNYSFDEWPAELQAEYAYNLEEAQALMDAAGVTTVDTEILTTPTDFPEVLEIWQSQLGKIGVNITINSMDMMAQRPVVQQGDFELLWVSVAGTANSSPLDAIQSFYSQKFERVGQGGGVIDAGYDAIVADFLAATTIDECIDIFHEADQYWLEQHWAVIGFPTLSNQMTQPWIKGYDGQSLWGTSTFMYYAHMWIDASLK